MKGSAGAGALDFEKHVIVCSCAPERDSSPVLAKVGLERWIQGRGDLYSIINQ